MNPSGIGDGGIRAEEMNDGFGQDGLEALPEAQVEAREREEQAGEHHRPGDLSQHDRDVPKKRGRKAGPRRPWLALEPKRGRHNCIIGLDRKKLISLYAESPLMPWLVGVEIAKPGGKPARRAMRIGVCVPRRNDRLGRRRAKSPDAHSDAAG
jgi:hypothetical protein